MNVPALPEQVNDPTASLSAERRGTLSLPDVESCFGGGKGRYGAKVGARVSSARGGWAGECEWNTLAVEACACYLQGVPNRPMPPALPLALSTRQPAPLSPPSNAAAHAVRSWALLQERADMLDQVEKRPDAMWRIGTQWSFKNEAKVGAKNVGMHCLLQERDQTVLLQERGQGGC